jgi:hypothetical protein
VQQIVAQTNEKDKPALEKLLMIAANTAGWSTADLHALLKKRSDPSIRNYTGFVKWSATIKRETKERQM